MAKRIGQIFLGLSLLQLLFACSGQSNGAGVERFSAESSVQKGQQATAAAATNSKGITNGSGVTVLSTFNPETDCASHGWPTSGSSSDAGYTMKFLLCSVLKSPDGPDTVRGGFDRISGFLCAAGRVDYDNTPKSVPFTVSTKCFSQTFTTMACTFINGSASNGPCSSTATVTGFTSTAGVAPTAYDKYVTISLASVDKHYTIAWKATGTTISAAAMDTLPGTAPTGAESTFAFHIDSEAGKMRYEGRFPGSNKRHMRINLTGTVGTDFTVTDVNNLSFVQGENFTGGGGLIVSVHGTPAAGRRIKLLNTSDMTVATPVWAGGGNPDDDTCIGEMGATCVGNTGIVAAVTDPKKFFFDASSGFTSSKNWFLNNSYLGTVSDTVDMDDIWD